MLELHVGSHSTGSVEDLTYFTRSFKYLLGVCSVLSPVLKAATLAQTAEQAGLRQSLLLPPLSVLRVGSEEKVQHPVSLKE